MDLKKVLKDGMFKNNPIFIQLIGLCSVLAVTNTLLNSLAMGVAVTFVLIMSNTVVSALRKIIPSKVRIPAFIVVIATFVTLVEMVLHAYLPPIYEALGIFLPLIVVNCCILGEADGFAYQNKIIPSFIDGLGTGLGYTIAVLAMGFVRELFGSGELFGTRIFPESYPGIGFLVAPAGAFVLLGFLIPAFRKIIDKKKEA